MLKYSNYPLLCFLRSFIPSHLCHLYFSLIHFSIAVSFQCMTKSTTNKKKKEIYKEWLWADPLSFRVTFTASIIAPTSQMRKKRGKKFRHRKFDAIALSPHGNTWQTRIWTRKAGIAWWERECPCLGVISNIMSVHQNLGPSESINILGNGKWL